MSTLTRRAGVIALITVLVSPTCGDAVARFTDEKRDRSTVRVDCVRFVQLDSQRKRIIGVDERGRRLVVQLAANPTVLGPSHRLADLRPADNVCVRSTFDPAGRVQNSDITVDVTAFSAMVTSRHDHGFDFIMLDYHSGIPARGAQYAGKAVVPRTAVIEIDREQAYAPGTLRDIAIGDTVKLYGFERPGARTIVVYRVEVWGHRSVVECAACAKAGPYRL
jgi:hypothetical protein